MFILPVVAFGETVFFLTPYLLLALLIPFATSYGVYFAGYEIVYEGKNIMNLQLAAANMQDYVKGKVLSAMPFSVAASAIVSVIIFIISPSLWPYLLSVALSCAFITMASGSIAANAAAIGGDFRAERMITRQRGAAVQMPIRGWSMLRAHLVPNLIGYSGVFGMFGVGMFVEAMYGELFGVLIAYAILPLFAFACYKLYSHYSYSAGLKLAQLEASEYL